MVRALETRVETADEFIRSTDGAMPGTGTAPARWTARLLAALACTALLAVGIGVLWDLWQRPDEPGPHLDSSAIARFATGQGLICQPPDRGVVALHWTCRSTSRAGLEMDWYELEGGRVTTVDATAGPPSSRGEAVAFFQSILGLTVPPDRRQDAAAWVSQHPDGGSTTMGRVAVETGSSGSQARTYTLSVDER
jgi:hypothetical protein